MSRNKDKNREKRKVTRWIGAAIPFLCLIPLFISFGAAKDLGIEGGELIAEAAVCCILILLTAAVRLFDLKLLFPVRLFLFVIFPIVPFFIIEFPTHLPFTMDFNISLLNLSVFIILTALIFFITNRSGISVCVMTVLSLLFGITNFYVLTFRGTPFFPWDFQSIGVAASVVGGYEFKISPRIALIVTIAVCVISLAFKWNIKIKRKRIIYGRIFRPVLVVVLALGLFFLGKYIGTDACISDFRLYPYLFSPAHLYETNGFTVSFLMNLKYVNVEKPEGYDAEKVEEITEPYSTDVSFDSKDFPDIIVIMNESYSDLGVFGEFKTNIDYMEPIEDIEGLIKGNLHVSVVGGNTPNSEFEFLTGLSMAFLPSGSIPYQQYIKSDTESLAHRLGEIGYDTCAMHPYRAAGWNRNTVYPMLGFDTSYFLDDFAGALKIRSYVSDSYLFSTIRNYMENSVTGNPKFVFAVTMQNHGGYTESSAGSFVPDIKVDGLESYTLSTYLSLVRRSGEAFRDLCNYYKDTDRKTIIVMFGDHQPNNSVAGPLLGYLGIDLEEASLEVNEKRYVVPYFIYSNFELNDVNLPEETSLNYLSMYIEELAGIPMTKGEKYVKSLSESIPFINSHSFEAGGVIKQISEYKENRDLTNYSRLQYNALFDKKHLPAEIWDFGLK